MASATGSIAARAGAGERQRGERKVSTDRKIADCLEVGLIVFLVCATIAVLIWLETRGAGLLERISNSRPTCFLVSCEAQAEPKPKPQSQPPQSKPQLPRHSLRTRPRVPDRVVVDGCPPLADWGHYSRWIHQPPRRSPIDCWSDRSMRDPCFD